jgi:hypothetical protein
MHSSYPRCERGTWRASSAGVIQVAVFDSFVAFGGGMYTCLFAVMSVITGMCAYALAVMCVLILVTCAALLEPFRNVYAARVQFQETLLCVCFLLCMYMLTLSLSLPPSPSLPPVARQVSRITRTRPAPPPPPPLSLYIYIYIYIYICMHACTHFGIMIQTYVYYIRTYNLHMNIRTYIHTQPATYIQPAHEHTYIHTYIHSRMR